MSDFLLGIEVSGLRTTHYPFFHGASPVKTMILSCFNFLSSQCTQKLELLGPDVPSPLYAGRLLCLPAYNVVYVL